MIRLFMKQFVVVFTAGILQLQIPAYAQGADETDDVLDVVLVTGGREGVRKLAGAATYIDEAEIQELDDTDLTDLLARSPGIYIRHEDGYGLRPNIGIRGAAAERSQKITVMEDGILITPAPYSAPAAYYLPKVNRMRAVEVVKGPSAIRFGPHSVGGAINLVSIPVPTKRTGAIEASFGTDNYQKYRGLLGDRIGNAGYTIDLLRYGADGFKELDGGGNTGFTRNDVNVSLDWRPESNWSLEHHLQFKIGYADEISDETYLGLTDGDFAITPDRRYVSSKLDRFASEHSQAHLIYSLGLPSGIQVVTKGYVNRFNRDWNKFDGLIGGPSVKLVLARPDIFPTEIGLLQGEVDSLDAGGQLIDVTNNSRQYGSEGLDISAQYDLVLGSFKHRLNAGLRYHHDYVDRDHHQRGYEMIGGDLVFDGDSNRQKKVFNNASTDAFAFFLNDEITFERWTLNAGVRVESIDRKLEDFLEDTLTSNDETVVLPGISAHWQWRDKVGIFAGIHKGFSPAAPAAGSVVNSEESTNFEYGLRYENTNTHIELIGFFSDYSNLIGRCRVSDFGCVPGEEFSAGDVQIAGAEFSLNYIHDFASGWSLPVALVYTYTESAFQTGFQSGFPQWGTVNTGDELPYTPENIARFQAGLENDSFSLTATLKFVSEMREVAGRGDLEVGMFTPSYTILDLGGKWALNESWNLLAVIENVGDQREIVSRRPIGARPTPPRLYRVGFRYDF